MTGRCGRRGSHAAKENGIVFVRKPKESDETLAVFKNLHGNLWDFFAAQTLMRARVAASLNRSCE